MNLTYIGKKAVMAKKQLLIFDILHFHKLRIVLCLGMDKVSNHNLNERGIVFRIVKFFF